LKSRKQKAEIWHERTIERGILRAHHDDQQDEKQSRHFEIREKKLISIFQMSAFYFPNFCFSDETA
jgi:hypothetical protein